MEVAYPAGQVISMYQNYSPEEKVEMLFRQYYAGLCRSLYRILRDASFAEDIVQEVFLKVWEMRTNLELNEAMQAYLYRSCYNTALNFLKAQKQQADVDLLQTMPGSDTAEKNLDLLETETQVLKAIDSLPPQTKLVFSLSRFEELSYKEIADRLEISVKTVEKHMGIALKRLRENLKDYLISIVFLLLLDFF